MTTSEASRIALEIQSGTLPVKFSPYSQQLVSASLGKDSLRNGVIAGIAGLAFVMIFLLLFYGFLGVIADIALIIYGLLLAGIVSALPVTMTLPGIAGTILTIGVAADANIVIFERVKEEVRAGKSMRAAIADRLPARLPHDHRRERRHADRGRRALRRGHFERQGLRADAPDRRRHVDLHRRRRHPGDARRRSAG